MKAITPEKINELYNESIASLNDLFKLKRVEKHFKELTPDQRAICEYIADKINEYIAFNSETKLEFGASYISNL